MSRLSAIQAVFDALMADPRVQKALAFIDADQANKIAELKELAVLHGVSFREGEERAPAFAEKLKAYGASGCAVDAHDNAVGRLAGTGGPTIVFEGHLDTVFAENVPLAVTEKDGVLCCPGIAEDTAGLASVLCVLRAIRHAGLKTGGDLIFAGTSGEEGEGDLRGVKGLLDDNKDIAALITTQPGPVSDVIYGAVGSRRYEISFKGPGGHSWADYGLPSAIHAMSRAIAKIAAVRPPDSPRTTYTAGVVSGGISVNSIAPEARCKLDMRSVSPDALAELERKLFALVDEGVAEENVFCEKSGLRVTVEKTRIGDRPAGQPPETAPIVQAALAAVRLAGGDPRLSGPSSTNANAAIGRGIPAMVARTGGRGGCIHSPDEWFDPAGSEQGDKAALLLILALAGLDGVTQPVALK